MLDLEPGEQRRLLLVMLAPMSMRSNVDANTDRTEIDTIDGFDAGEDSNSKIEQLSDPGTKDALNTANAAADAFAHGTLMLQ